MTFLAQNSNSVINFRLDRHVKSISGSTGNLRGRPSTRANHCGMQDKDEIITNTFYNSGEFRKKHPKMDTV